MRPLYATALALLAVVAFPRPASAIPVISGSGDTVAHVADLPAGSPARMPGKFVWGGNPTKVGYKYYRFHIFWMPLWTSTSAGEFVAYDKIGYGGTWYLPLGTNPHEVSARTGVPVSQLTVPWSVGNPWGLYLLIGGLVLGLLLQLLIVSGWWLDLLVIVERWCHRPQTSNAPSGGTNPDVAGWNRKKTGGGSVMDQAPARRRRLGSKNLFGLYLLLGAFVLWGLYLLVGTLVHWRR